MLGVYLGNDFLCAKPDNPTGYWQHWNIYDINERLLTVLGLKWEDITLIDDARWHEPEVEALLAEAIEYLRSQFLSYALWGSGRSPHYPAVAVLAISAPPSRRGRELPGCVEKPSQCGKLSTPSSGYEWGNSALTVASVHGSKSGKIAKGSFVVSDYDLVMAEPRRQLERIARCLRLPLDGSEEAGIEQFASAFLDPALRHSYFDVSDVELDRNLPLLAREAFLWLHRLATDRTATDSLRFWAAWEINRQAVERLIAETGCR